MSELKDCLLCDGYGLVVANRKQQGHIVYPAATGPHSCPVCRPDDVDLLMSPLFEKAKQEV